jgi:hypothetical protein
VATAREYAVSFLYSEWDRAAGLREVDTDQALPEREGRVTGVLRALAAVGLLDADEAESWRLRLSDPDVRRPEPSDRTREVADELLQELLQAVPEDDDGRGEALLRFDGALQALHAVGIAAMEWYDRRNRRMGWPTADEARERNAGGTQSELRAVIAGPPDAVDGVLVMCALCFADGVSVLLRLEDGEDAFRRDPFAFELSDDVGTSYWLASGGGGATDVRLTFATPAPVEARWLELRGEGSRPIRISL